MKKTLIALTLAALPVASMADVILYGQIKGGVEVTKIKDVKGTVTNIVDYGSRIGFKGHEQLNGSLKAIWQLEQAVDVGGGKGRTFGTRDSFIGLSGENLGTVKVGYQQTPVKELNSKLDIWEYDSYAAGLGRFTRDTDAVKRATAITYETPNFGGFTAKAYVSPSDNNRRQVVYRNGIDPIASQRNGTPTPANPSIAYDENGRKSTDSAIYGLSFSYQHEKGFFGDVAGVYVRNGLNNLTSRNNGYQVLAQGGFENDKWMAALGYQYSHSVDSFNASSNNPQLDTLYTARNSTTSANAVSDSLKGHEVVLSGAYTLNDSVRLKGSAAYGFGIQSVGSHDQYTIGADNTTATYSHTGHVKSRGNGKYYQAVLGADYLFSKRTTANAQIGYYQAGKGAEKVRGGTLSVGMKHKF